MANHRNHSSLFENQSINRLGLLLPDILENHGRVRDPPGSSSLPSIPRKVALKLSDITLEGIQEGLRQGSIWDGAGADSWIRRLPDLVSPLTKPISKARGRREWHARDPHDTPPRHQWQIPCARHGQGTEVVGADGTRPHRCGHAQSSRVKALHGGRHEQGTVWQQPESWLWSQPVHIQHVRGVRGLDSYTRMACRSQFCHRAR